MKDRTNKMMEDYGFTIEPLEVFYHLSKVIKEAFRENYSICYVSHSAGGAAPLFTSVFMNDQNTTHVSISPENCRNDRMEWCDHSFFQNDYPQKAKKLTMIYGENEFKDEKESTNQKATGTWDAKKTKRNRRSFQKYLAHTISFYEKVRKFPNISIANLVGNLNHQEIAQAGKVSKWGDAVLKGCGFAGGK